MPLWAARSFAARSMATRAYTLGKGPSTPATAVAKCNVDPASSPMYPPPPHTTSHPPTTPAACARRRVNTAPQREQQRRADEQSSKVAVAWQLAHDVALERNGITAELTATAGLVGEPRASDKGAHVCTLAAAAAPCRARRFSRRQAPRRRAARPGCECHLQIVPLRRSTGRPGKRRPCARRAVRPEAAGRATAPIPVGRKPRALARRRRWARRPMCGVAWAGRPSRHRRSGVAPSCAFDPLARGRRVVRVIRTCGVGCPRNACLVRMRRGSSSWGPRQTWPAPRGRSHAALVQALRDATVGGQHVRHRGA